MDVSSFWFNFVLCFPLFVGERMDLFSCGLVRLRFTVKIKFRIRYNLSYLTFGVCSRYDKVGYKGDISRIKLSHGGDGIKMDSIYIIYNRKVIFLE